MEARVLSMQEFFCCFSSDGFHLLKNKLCVPLLNLKGIGTVFMFLQGLKQMEGWFEGKPEGTQQ